MSITRLIRILYATTVVCLPLVCFAKDYSALQSGTLFNVRITDKSIDKIGLRIGKFNDVDALTPFEKIANAFEGCSAEGFVGATNDSERVGISINKIVCDGHAKDVKAYVVDKNGLTGVKRTNLVVGAELGMLLTDSVN